MARQQEELSVYKGRYHRTIGRALNERGQPVPRKFLLGTDRAAAEVANRLLEQLWEDVVAEHQDALRLVRDWGGRLGDTNAIAGEMDVERLRRVDAERLRTDDEIASLRQDEICRDGQQVWIKRIRRKNRVYGEFALWPKTIAAMGLPGPVERLRPKSIAESFELADQRPR